MTQLVLIQPRFEPGLPTLETILWTTSSPLIPSGGPGTIFPTKEDVCNSNVSKMCETHNHAAEQARADVLRFPTPFSFLSIPASGALAAGSAPSHPLPNPAVTHNDVPASDKLQAHLEHGDVQEVDEVAQVIHQQPEVDVARRLIGEGPAHGNQPAVPVPGQHHEEEPQDVHQVCRGGGREGAGASAGEGPLASPSDRDGAFLFPLISLHFLTSPKCGPS